MMYEQTTRLEFVCGIDDAGRGPLAGPVAAASVILPDDFPREYLNDSKKLSEKNRLIAEKIIIERALWGIAFASHEEIDEINILQASLLAMKRAFADMCGKLAVDGERVGIKDVMRNNACIHIIVDGNKIPAIEDSLIQKIDAVVKADASVYEVMAASILVKCARDRLMIEYANFYPAYGYEKHKGYPTKAHRTICREIGPSPIQRRTFKY
jgi:ribonuclease HII